MRPELILLLVGLSILAIWYISSRNGTKGSLAGVIGSARKIAKSGIGTWRKFVPELGTVITAGLFCAAVAIVALLVRSHFRVEPLPPYKTPTSAARETHVVSISGRKREAGEPLPRPTPGDEEYAARITPNGVGGCAIEWSGNWEPRNLRYNKYVGRMVLTPLGDGAFFGDFYGNMAQHHYTGKENGVVRLEECSVDEGGLPYDCPIGWAEINGKRKSVNLKRLTPGAPKGVEPQGLYGRSRD